LGERPSGKWGQVAQKHGGGTGVGPNEKTVGKGRATSCQKRSELVGREGLKSRGGE